MSGNAQQAASACFRLLEEALYPSHVACALCNREALLDERNLCATCAATLVPCGVLDAPPPLDGLFAAYQYKGGAVAGIHALKYSNLKRVSHRSLQTPSISPPEWLIDASVPVPLHPLKQWLRTYNQSELIAKALSTRLSEIEPETMRRTRFTQTKPR